MTKYSKEERWEILRLAKRARGLNRAEHQALLFVAEAQTMQDGICTKAIARAEDQAYEPRSVIWGLHGKRRKRKDGTYYQEYDGIIKRGIVIASGNLKGGRAAGGRGLTATYTIDLAVLMTFVPEIDDPDPKGDNDHEKGETYPETLGETYHETKGETEPKKGETYPDLIQTSSFSSSLTASAESADASAAAEKLGTASAPIGEPSPSTNSTTAQETAARTSTSTVGDIQSSRSESQPLGDGGSASSLIAVDSGVSAPDASPTSGRIAAPTSGVPLPSSCLPTPLRGAAPSAPHAPAGSTTSRGQSETDPSEALISVVRLRQLERSMTDAQIYTEYKAVFDRVVREAVAYNDLPHKDREGMPRGARLENPLNSTVKHRASAAEFYRIVGGAPTLAKWEDFLVNTDHTKFVGKPVLDENDVPTGKFYSDEEEAKWLLYDFVKEQGGVPQPAPVVHSITDEERIIEMLVAAGISRESALRECGRLGVQKIWDGIREVLQEKTT